MISTRLTKRAEFDNVAVKQLPENHPKDFHVTMEYCHSGDSGPQLHQICALGAEFSSFARRIAIAAAIASLDSSVIEGAGR